MKSAATWLHYHDKEERGISDDLIKQSNIFEARYSLGQGDEAELSVWNLIWRWERRLQAGLSYRRVGEEEVLKATHGYNP